MSRCSCGCHDVETNVEKLQSLLAIESHLDEELDDLERRYQLDQLKYEWLTKEGYPDLCDVIKQQMQKTESLLLMYTPMLQDTCAEKEAHITHILAMQRHRQLTAHWGQHQQPQQLQQELLQGQTHGMFSEWQFDPNNFLNRYPSMLSGYHVQNQRSNYLSPNTRALVGNSETRRREKEKSSGGAVDERKADRNAFPSLQKEYSETKRSRNRNILRKSKGWRRKGLLRCTLFSIQRSCSHSNIVSKYLKERSDRTKKSCVLGQSHHQHSLLKSIQRKRYKVHSKQIKLKTKNKTYEGNSSCGKIHKSTNITQLMKVKSSNKTLPHMTRTNKFKLKRSVCSYNYLQSKTFGNNSKCLQVQGKLPSILRPRQMQTLPGQDHSPFLFRMPSDSLHKCKQSSKSRRLVLQRHDQEALNRHENKNPNVESRNSLPSRSDMQAGQYNRSITQNVDVSFPFEEWYCLNSNDYGLSNWSEEYDLSGTQSLRE